MRDPVITPGAWTLIRVEDVASGVSGVGRAAGHPIVVAIDGRSAAGKSTAAAELAAVLRTPSVIHTDDVAWHHSFFDWWPLLRDHLLLPLRAGHDVSWRPPGWDSHDRPGSIDVPAAPVIVVEGVGASRRELADIVEIALWAEGDPVEQERRGVVRDGVVRDGMARDGDQDGAQRFWDEWQAEERPFLDRDRPWERADLLILGTPAAPARLGTWWARRGPGGRLRV